MSPERLSRRERRERQEDAIGAMADYEQLYAASRSPVWVFQAWLHARGASVPVPLWVLGYLDAAARNVMDLTGEPPKARSIAPAVARALGFLQPGKGRRNPFAVRDRDRSIAASVFLHRVSGHKLLHAYEAAAAKHGVTRRTAERAWRKYPVDLFDPAKK